MNKIQSLTACAAVSALLAGCASGASGPNGIPKITTVDPLSTGKLQFAVGTANLYGTATGLNVVSTYRQASGISNVLLDTPTITGPFTLPAAQPAGNFLNGKDPYSTLADGTSAAAGPSVEEVAVGGEITGTSASLHIGTPACDSTTPCVEANASTGGTTTVAPNTSTFGQSGGVFTDGISPGNSTQGGVATSYVPYIEPIYDTTSGNSFIPFGGPPAFGGSNGLGVRDGLSNLGAGVLGVPLGFNTFAGVTVSTGSYKLSVQVPTGISGTVEQYGTAATSATLASTATLGTIVAPTLALDGNGGGSFAIAAFPAGVTEELVLITDDGTGTGVNCQGAIGAEEGAGPVYYTILAKAPGTYSLPDTIGPNSDVTSGRSVITPSPSLCTAAQNTTAASGTATPGDSYTVQAIGADYPLYESLYPNTTSQTPTLTGANGQADITISALTGGLTSSARVRKSALRAKHRII